MGRRTYRLTLCYDGTRYRGWQRLPNAETVQGRLESALSEIFGEAIEVDGSGRTDAGVHAMGQVASFRAEELPLRSVLTKLRAALPADIGAVELTYAPDRFHARLSAAEKIYTYSIHNSSSPDVFARKYRLQIPQKLDLAAMRLAAEKICGTHDFIAFCSNKHFKKSSIRTVKSIEISEDGDDLAVVLCADGFLYNMARIIVGTLLEIGLGKRSVDSVDEIFAQGRRELAGETAPAKGLSLTEVHYEHSDFREI